MAETPYPHYKLQADGPSEAGFTLYIQITEGAGGPLAGLTAFEVVDYLRDYLAGQSGVTAQLSRHEVANTYNL